ncbi:hypothetical protein GCM10025876_33900 [Demequina litorisediminis]|uniref:Uncharacterized protein n=1 Tax=Demequina litorisediminis TaxID=1849022 RepID=A0ABQ6IJA6_9MICO|nr:hypothetical protein GCM10025876_33900 [Demequina litorisediminis]
MESQASGRLAPQFAHLRGGLQVVTVAVEREALAALVVGGLVEVGTRLDAQQRLVRHRVVLAHVVRVVRRHERRAQLVREAQQVLADTLLQEQPVVHQLDIEVLGTKDVLELARRAQRLVVLPQTQARLHLARGATSGGDDAVRVALQQVAVHTRLVEVPLEGGVRRHPEEVVHARRVLRPHGHVGVGATGRDVVGLLAALTPPHARLVLTRGARREVRLDADDGLHAMCLALCPEVVGTKDVAVVGSRKRRLTQFLRVLEQIIQPRGTVQHRVLGMDVEVNKIGARHGIRF